ncbi:MAG: FAD-dependent oxidoreductase, partial [Pseudomonadota bacterium]
AERAHANGVTDLRSISASEARALEPEVTCVGALLSPSTGVVDSHGLMVSLLGDAEAGGAMLALQTPVRAIRQAGDGFTITTGDAAPMTLTAREVINAAGHGAVPLCDGLLPAGEVPGAWFARGCYFKLSGRAPFSRLIYPAPVPGGLGTHLTLDLAGQARFGPDVEWIEQEDYTLDPARGDSFYADIRRYWPALPDGALQPDYTGIRPKITGPGTPAADFRIERPCAGLVTLFGIESPGLTASLAIGDMVRGLLDAR